MKDTKVKRIQHQVICLKQQFLQGETGVFDQALSRHEMAALVGELIPPHRERLYPPFDTLRLFVGQVLSTDRACQDVVGRRLSERIAQGRPPSALTTSAYCDARQRLPLQLPTALGNKLGEHGYSEPTIATAASPHRATCKETTTEKSSVINHASPSRKRPDSCSTEA